MLQRVEPTTFQLFKQMVNVSLCVLQFFIQILVVNQDAFIIVLNKEVSVG